MTNTPRRHRARTIVGIYTVLTLLEDAYPGSLVNVGSTYSIMHYSFRHPCINIEIKFRRYLRYLARDYLLCEDWYYSDNGPRTTIMCVAQLNTTTMNRLTELPDIPVTSQIGEYHCQVEHTGGQTYLDRVQKSIRTMGDIHDLREALVKL